MGSTPLKMGFLYPRFSILNHHHSHSQLRTLTIVEQSRTQTKMLMRIFGNSGKVAGSEAEIDEYDFVEDLSSWEFVIPSDDDDDHEAYSFNGEELEDDDVEIGIEPEGTLGEIGLKQDESYLLGSPSSDVSMGSPSPSQITVLLDVASAGLTDYKNDYDIDNEEEEEDEEYDDDDYDLDEELVPYCARNKLVKQRMKKLSKMTCPRMNKPKRLPYYYNKPGAMWKIR